MRLVLIKLLNDNNLDDIIKLSFEYAIWNLYLDLLILKQKYIDYIRTALILMDINLLSKNTLFIKIFKYDFNLGKVLFEKFIEQKNMNSDELDYKAICLNCKKKLDSDYMRWQDMIDFLHKNLKLNDLIDLLLIYHSKIPKSVLNPKLCFQLLQVEMIKRYQSTLNFDKLVKLNHHLVATSVKNSKQEAGIKTKNWSTFIDLNLKDCDICKKSLKNCKNSLLIFKCNHIYHKDCEENSNPNLKKTCYVCLNFK
jgi:hypothetical protein